jgi:beta-1,4-mannosyl-glycoprotein beta-1,4-N-acetylglucosaminyltransferase
MTIMNENKRVIDCFTFYNELEVLELRLTELYDVVDKFVILEAEKTHKGENKRFIFEENKWRFEKWLDKIIHVKVYYPSHINDPWGREKFQRNSSIPTLYTLGLNDNDVIFITDVDEILNSERVNYIKTSYDLKEVNKMEMITYFGNFYNKQDFPKWYHPKVVNWGTLKTTTPDDCRLNFNCQWWENGGWHLTYFGGTERIINKIENFAHQEYNKEEFKNRDYINTQIKEGKDLFGEWRKFERIEPAKNPNLPKNWKILQGISDAYEIDQSETNKKDLVLGAAIGIDIEHIKIFIESFRKFNTEAEFFLIVENNIADDKKKYLEGKSVRLLYNESSLLYHTPPNNSRFLKCLDFIKENEGYYRNILLPDISDVVFQGDPFKDLIEDFIYFAEEDESETIETNSFNSRWVNQCFGPDILNEIKKNKISCCGTVIGSIKNIKIYLEEMCKQMVRVKNESPVYFSDMMDQGIHNYICYKKLDLFNNPTMKSNGDFISTIGITCLQFPEKIENNGEELKVNGKTPCIVHQYNRSKDLIDFYTAKYIIDDTTKHIIDNFNKVKDNLKLAKYDWFNIYTLSNDGMGKHIIDGLCWESHIVNFLKNNTHPDSVFIDIGSNYGWHSIIASKLCNRVYSFEPQKLMHDIQKMSICKNNIDNIILDNNALGNEDKESQMESIDYLNNSVNIGDLSIGKGGENITIKRLDSYQFDRVDIIKIDVQGYEKFILEGGKKTIEENRPILIVEFEEFQLNKFDYSCKDLFDMIRDMDYEIYYLEYEYPSDHVCVHKDMIKDFELNNKILPLEKSNHLNRNLENGITKKIINNI